MRKFASEAELRRYALEKGAAIGVGSATFNAGRDKVRIEPAKPKTPLSPAAPVEKPSHEFKRDLAAEAISYQTVTLAEFFRDLIDTLRQPDGDDRPVEAWDFEVQRNQDGLISRVTARAMRS